MKSLQAVFPYTSKVLKLEAFWLFCDPKLLKENYIPIQHKYPYAMSEIYQRFLHVKPRNVNKSVK